MPHPTHQIDAAVPLTVVQTANEVLDRGLPEAETEAAMVSAFTELAAADPAASEHFARVGLGLELQETDTAQAAGHARRTTELFRVDFPSWCTKAESEDGYVYFTAETSVRGASVFREIMIDIDQESRTVSFHLADEAGIFLPDATSAVSVAAARATLTGLQEALGTLDSEADR